jgi:hypothetical protein
MTTKRSCTLGKAVAFSPPTLSAETLEHVRAGLEEAVRGEFADMTDVETERYLETGELPEHVQRWLAD